jgi:predicted Zn-dependent protease
MTAQAYGDLHRALAHTQRLLPVDPANAEIQAREILKAVPGNLDAAMLLGAALRRQGRLDAALAALRPLTGHSGALYECGLLYAELGRDADAIACLTDVVAHDPQHPDAWRALGDLRAQAEDETGAAEAYARHIQASVRNPRLMEAAKALCANQLGVAERLLRGFLKENPTDVGAIRMLAEVAGRIGRYEDAENLLARALELAPDFHAARHNYATILQRRNKFAEALVEIDILLRHDPQNSGARNLMAVVLARLGDTGQAIAVYEQVVAEHPDHPQIWMSLGHTLKTAGRRDDSIAAYRKSIASLPAFGEAYWSLANLKTFRFAPDEIAAMRAQLARSDIGTEDRFHLHFALGKALEDAADYADSFQQYAQGNALRRQTLKYSAAEITDIVARLKAQFSVPFLNTRAGMGCAAPDPIFIVGLPRAGSTLVEQILSSHSMIEGTMELPDIMAMTSRLGGRTRDAEQSAYPEMLSTLSDSDLKVLGAEYLERTRIQRKAGRPLFIDKMPNNFLHAGFIHMILPNARIIDVRRHPMGCGFSCFKQHFARGQAFTYDLEDLGRYYADYTDLMAHYDAVMPGRVHRVQYEQLIADPEGEVRRLLDYCGVPFEDGCLRFYQNDRVVRTASSEQVRVPIFTEAIDHWRHYESWLQPLKDALGAAMPR